MLRRHTRNRRISRNRREGRWGMRLSARSVFLGCVPFLTLVAFLSNGQLLSGSLWCDQRIARLASESDTKVRQAMAELSAALGQQAATLRMLHEEQARRRTLHRQLEELQHAGARAPSLHPPAEAIANISLRGAAAGGVSGAAEGGGARAVATSGPGVLRPQTIAVVVIAYSRPEYLDRALRSILAYHPRGDGFHVYVSQDGEHAGVQQTIERHGVRRLVHPRTTLKLRRNTYVAKHPGYAYLAVHYGWALRTLFDAPGNGTAAKSYEGVIILEEDIEVAPDFFDYFAATAPLLYKDDSLLCVSAFNDNGQAKYSGDPTALHRSDFFPGLGWLMSRRLWAQLGPTWPNEDGFWDDWLREPPQRRGRSSIYPEVSRTYTFGEKGVSIGQFFHKYLGRIELNSKRVDWQSQPLEYLLKEQYDAELTRQVNAAPSVPLDEALASATDARVLYKDSKEFISISRRLGIMEDLKAGVPRTGYKGIVILKVNSKRIYICPSYRVDQDITKPLPG